MLPRWKRTEEEHREGKKFEFPPIYHSFIATGPDLATEEEQLGIYVADSLAAGQAWLFVYTTRRRRGRRRRASKEGTKAQRLKVAAYLD